MRLLRLTFALSPLLAGCAVKPPPSQLPSAQAAVERMRATAACGLGVNADAKADYFGAQGRVRIEVLMLAVRPARVRMMATAFNTNAGTLTSDGARFAFEDVRNKRFLHGPAKPCNIARLTGVRIPAHVLVDVLRGQAPVLAHAPGAGSIEWDGGGWYVVRVPGTSGSSEEIHVAPRPDDWSKPWAEQRLRVLDVLVRQQGHVLYHAALDEHQAARTAAPKVDPEHIDPDLPPSGPACDAEVPRRIHVEVPEEGSDVQFRYDKVEWNPPLEPGVFQLQPSGGLTPELVDCE